MDNIAVLVSCGTEQWLIHFSRVPVLGERVRFRDREYVVRGVVHTPGGNGHVAEIAVSVA